MVLGLVHPGGIGTAGIPSGSLPVIAMICGIIGLKPGRRSRSSSA
jgi:DAACS family dicarboxylate/amino acid:cation (Na+ or H+) symporter